MISTQKRAVMWPLYAALIATCLAGWLFKAHCMVGGGWANGIQYVTGCYSDAVPFWGGRGVADGEVPYFQARIEYPVLTGLVIWIDGGLTRLLFGAQANASHFLGVVTLVNTLFAAAVMALLARMGVARSRLWWWAAAPPLLLYVGHNWDLLAIMLAVAAVVAAREGRPGVGAALAGLGVAAKLFPVVFLPLLGLAALFDRRPGDWRVRIARAAALVAAAVGAWALVNLLPALFAFTKWSEFYSFSATRGGTAASIWEILAWFRLAATDISTRNSLASLSFVIGAAGIIAAGWRRHRDRPWVLFTPVLAWFLLTNKVYSPQFDLWLYPLLVMTCRRNWPIALFALTDIEAYFAEFWMFAGNEGHWPATTMNAVALAAGARAIVMFWIIYTTVRDDPPAWMDRIAVPGASLSRSSVEAAVAPTRAL